MTQARIGWEKDVAQQEKLKHITRGNDRRKFLIGGILIFAAAFYLIVTSTLSGARYFITVDEVVQDAAYVGETVRITGAVIGDSIIYDTSDPDMPVIHFRVAHLPNEMDNLAEELHLAVNDTTRTQLAIRVENEPMPDLLQHEAQAILTGEIGPDGVFHANELLLKCPSRFEEDGPGESLVTDL